LNKILWHEGFYNAYLGVLLEVPHVIFDKFGKFIWGEGGGSGNFWCSASAVLFGVVRSFFAAIFGAMSSDFPVKPLVAFYEFHFLFFRMVGGTDSIDVHMVSSLRGSLLLVLVFDSKCFVESTAKAVMEGVLFLSFPVVLDCLLGPMFKGPGGSKGVISI
jgi:hypothetical protein